MATLQAPYTNKYAGQIQSGLFIAQNNGGTKILLMTFNSEIPGPFKNTSLSFTQQSASGGGSFKVAVTGDIPNPTNSVDYFTQYSAQWGSAFVLGNKLQAILTFPGGVFGKNFLFPIGIIGNA